MQVKKVDTGDPHFSKVNWYKKIPLKENLLKTKFKIVIVNSEGKGFEWGHTLKN